MQRFLVLTFLAFLASCQRAPSIVDSAQIAEWRSYGATQCGGDAPSAVASLDESDGKLVLWVSGFDGDIDVLGELAAPSGREGFAIDGERVTEDGVAIPLPVDARARGQLTVTLVDAVTGDALATTTDALPRSSTPPRLVREGDDIIVVVEASAVEIDASRPPAREAAPVDTGDRDQEARP